MKTQLKKINSALAIIALLCIKAIAQNPNAFDNYILDFMQDNNVPGLSFALIKDGKLAIAKGYGYADIENDVPYTANTLNPEIASVSKTVTATAVLKLWEQGLFQLDDQVNNYLPFPVTNPFYPATPITFRMLLSHTSSICVDTFTWGSFLYSPIGSPDPLETFLENFLVPGGSLYVDSISYFKYPPGSQYNYSNFGYALLGYLVERISGMPFAEYCNQNIFQPLCMNHTGWFFGDVDMNTVARPYTSNALPGNYDNSYYETVDYPCRQLKTNVVDFSKYVLMHMNYGEFDGTRVIDSTTELMMRNLEVMTDDTPSTPFIAYECLGWNYVKDISLGGREFIGHNGHDYGVSTEMWINLSHGTGTIIFTNSEAWVLPIHFFLDQVVKDTLYSGNKPVLNCDYQFNPCQHNPNYWRTHSNDWALNAVPMKLGTEYYNSGKMHNLLNKYENDNACIALAKALITAKLNIAQGSELSPIAQTINDAMNLIGSLNLLTANVSITSPEGIQMLALASTLDSYNSGAMNANACSGSSESANDGEESNFQYQLTNSSYQLTNSRYQLTNSPNPVSTSTTISFSIPQYEKVTLNLYNVSGSLVQSIADEEMNEGLHQVVWNSEKVNAGIYFLIMETSSYSENLKIIVIK